MRLGPEGREAEGRRIAPEETLRVRLENDRTGLRLFARSDGAGLCQQRLMAAMDAIEIAKRHHRPAMSWAKRSWAAENQHELI